MSRSGTSISSMTHSISMTPVQLASELQVIVDYLFDLHPQWEGDQRIAELIDVQRLNDLGNQLGSIGGLSCATCHYDISN